jgi:hypothetical protein
MFLTGAMALVTWGVWHTLTQHSHSDPEQGEDVTPKWPREVNSRSKPQDGSSTAGESGRYDAARRDDGVPGGGQNPGLASIDGLAGGNTPSAGTGNAVAGSFDPGPPLPPPKDTVRDSMAPRVGGTSSAGPPTQPKENPAETLESQRLADQFDALIKRVKEAKAAGQLVPAYEELSIWYPQRDKLNLARSELMLNELDGLARDVLYSPKSYPPHRPYMVTTETLAAIAKPLLVPPELLAKINAIQRPDQIRGKELKVVHGPFHAEIRLSKFELTMLVGSKRLYAGRFRIGLGPEGVQPGTFTVVQKQMFPKYYPDPANRQHIIPGGDPHNALGSRLIVFKSAEGLDGAVHGTNDPLSLGKNCKEGGIRLDPQQIEHVYDMLLENESQVIVRE